LRFIIVLILVVVAAAAAVVVANFLRAFFSVVQPTDCLYKFTEYIVIFILYRLTMAKFLPTDRPARRRRA